MKTVLIVDMNFPNGMVTKCHAVAETLIDVQSGGVQLVVSSWDSVDDCISGNPPATKSVVQAGNIELGKEWNECSCIRLSSLWGGVVQQLEG